MAFVGSTIEKTIMMGFLFAKFWDRWIMIGLRKPTISDLRNRLYNLDDWIRILRKQADAYILEAENRLGQSLPKEAEERYRLAALKYSIIQWMHPKTGDEKRKWYKYCKDMHQADDEIIYTALQVDGGNCFGKIRIPAAPKGCVSINNPLDSSKEELMIYEHAFARMGFVAVCFDGPGQGETYVHNEYQASLPRWSLFMNQVIEFTAAQYPQWELFLFGTGSGAAWAIHGSHHPKILKTVAVSPAFESDIPIPDYIKERLAYIAHEQAGNLTPNLESIAFKGPIFLIHGNKDELVKSEGIHDLNSRLPEGSHFAAYEDEGHCCSYRTSEILRNSSDWFLK